MATFEAKLLQHISGLRQEVLYKIFVYIHNVCDALNQGCTLTILEGYGVGPQVSCLLTRYWYWSTMAASVIIY